MNEKDSVKLIPWTLITSPEYLIKQPHVCPGSNHMRTYTRYLTKHIMLIKFISQRNKHATADSKLVNIRAFVNQQLQTLPSWMWWWTQPPPHFIWNLGFMRAMRSGPMVNLLEQLRFKWLHLLHSGLPGILWFSTFPVLSSCTSWTFDPFNKHCYCSSHQFYAVPPCSLPISEVHSLRFSICYSPKRPSSFIALNNKSEEPTDSATAQHRCDKHNRP